MRGPIRSQSLQQVLPARRVLLMLESREQRRELLQALLAVLALLALLFGAHWALSSGAAWRFSHRHHIAAANQCIGQQEVAVRAMLGEPYHVYEDGADADTKPYPLPGYAAPHRPLSARALLYIKGDMIVYIYFNAHGTVEDVFYGPS
ncbi:MAG: hypothetical protein HUU35_11620 [Armatimonadetes bacterium]|nr:hypothetical protein [Armatimonadota bacterium]